MRKPEWETPGSISNPAVKPLRADGSTGQACARVGSAQNINERRDPKKDSFFLIGDEI